MTYTMSYIYGSVAALIIMTNACLQLDPKTMDDLDANLREGMETDLLYREFLKTIPKDYLEIENVSMRSDHEAVEVCVCVCVYVRVCVGYGMH